MNRQSTGVRYLPTPFRCQSLKDPSKAGKPLSLDSTALVREKTLGAVGDQGYGPPVDRLHRLYSTKGTFTFVRNKITCEGKRKTYAV